MLEAYLFIDPLCTHCIRSEKDFLKIASNLNDKFLYQFIPVLSINMQHHSTEYYKNNQMTRAQQCRINYYAVLDYYAALFQGKKFGRKFLMLLQNELLNHQQKYDDQLVFKVAQMANLDLEMFKEDRRSDLAKESFKRDQKLALEMKIKSTSSAVVFDCGSNQDGLRFDHFDYTELYRACHNFKDHKPFKGGFHGFRIPNLNHIKL